jgi:hypothetical protein
MSRIRGWRADAPEPAKPSEDERPWRRELENVAGRLSRLSLSWRDPERFSLERSELVATLRRIARNAGGDQ